MPEKNAAAIGKIATAWSACKRGQPMSSLPSVIHPTKFNINGIVLEVVSFEPLNNEQAGWVAGWFYRNHKWKKKDRGKLNQAVTVASPRDIDGFLEAGRQAAEELRRLLP